MLLLLWIGILSHGYCLSDLKCRYPNQKTDSLIHGLLQHGDAVNGAQSSASYICGVSATTLRPPNHDCAAFGLGDSLRFPDHKTAHDLGAWPCPKCEPNDVLPLL